MPPSVWAKMPAMETWRLYSEAMERERQLRAALVKFVVQDEPDVAQAELKQLRRANRLLTTEKRQVEKRSKAHAESAAGRESVLYLEVQKLRHANSKLSHGLEESQSSAAAHEMERLTRANSKLALSRRQAEEQVRVGALGGVYFHICSICTH